MIRQDIFSARVLDAAFPKQPAPSTITTQVLEATNWPSSPSFSNLPATGSGTSVSVVRNASNPKLNGPTMHFGPDETQVVRNALTTHPTWVGWVWKNSTGTPHTHSDYSNLVLELTFNKKVWSVDNGILGGDLVKPAVQQGPLTQVLNVEQGTSLDVELSGASDTDHWALNGKEGDEDDKTLTYKWTADAGQFSSPDSAASKWTAPLLPPGVDSITITITGQVNNDNPPPFGPDETGKRKDDAVTHSFTVVVAKKIWNADTPIGEGRDANNNPINNGRLISPVDRRSHDAQPVKVGPGGRLGFEVEEAMDTDTWKKKSPEGVVIASGTSRDKIKSYIWKCDAGKFVKLDAEGKPELDADGKEQFVDTMTGLKTTWVAWSSPKKVKVWCEIEDEGPAVPQNEGGTRDDDALKSEQEVEIVPVKLQARRMQSPEESQPDEWSDDEQNAAVIAAGGVNSPEQKAEVRLVYNDALVDFPVGNVTLNTDEAKGEDGPDGILTMNGAQGEYKSSNMVEALVHLKLESGPESQEIGIWQFWGDQYDWSVAPEFEYGAERPLSFTPFVGDGSRTSIKGQRVTFAPNKITFYSWDKASNDYKAQTLQVSDSDRWKRVAANVQFLPATVPSSTGTYSTNFKVLFDKKRMIDEVEFAAWGEDVLK